MPRRTASSSSTALRPGTAAADSGERPEYRVEALAKGLRILSLFDEQRPTWRVSDLAARHREFAARLGDRHSQMIPAEDPDYEPLGPAFPAWPNPGRNAILQPPKIRTVPTWPFCTPRFDW